MQTLMDIPDNLSIILITGNLVNIFFIQFYEKELMIVIWKEGMTFKRDFWFVDMQHGI